MRQNTFKISKIVWLIFLAVTGVLTAAHVVLGHEAMRRVGSVFFDIPLIEGRSSGDGMAVFEIVFSVLSGLVFIAAMIFKKIIFSEQKLAKIADENKRVQRWFQSFVISTALLMTITFLALLLSAIGNSVFATTLFIVAFGSLIVLRPRGAIP